MNVLVSYSRPRGKYGRYVFTVMIHFSEPKETASIEVVRPQTQTHTHTVYSCDYCGRWATIATHITTQFTTHTPLQQAEHRKDGRLELYRYDNVEPDDIINLTLRDAELLKYQCSRVIIGWEDVSLSNYWRNPKLDRVWSNHVVESKRDYKAMHGIYDDRSYTELERQQYFDTINNGRDKEPHMTDETLYEVMLISWDQYMQEKTDEMRMEEELIEHTMKTHPITIKELLLEPLLISA
jgi:hypothetical protein